MTTQKTRHREKHRMLLHSDYETIEFTPEIGDDSLDGSGEGQVYGVQIGRARRQGNWVDFNMSVTITDLGTLTGANQANVLGLPRPMRTLANYIQAFSIRGLSLNITAGQSLCAIGVSGDSHVRLSLWDDIAGVTVLTITELSAGAVLNISGSYETDDLTE